MKNLIRILVFGICAWFLACGSPASSSGNGDVAMEYNPTDLPIQLEALSQEVKDFIKKAHETDTSSYLIDTRPILFQIQGVGNQANETRGTAMLYDSVEVMIYAFGELLDNRLVDYGWIQNVHTLEMVWQMNLKKAQSAGGAERNLKFVDHITLPPGRYELRYISNDAHSNDGWNGAPPERPFYYGITVFNLKAIEGFKEVLVE